MCVPGSQWHLGMILRPNRAGKEHGRVDIIATAGGQRQGARVRLSHLNPEHPDGKSKNIVS